MTTPSNGKTMLWQASDDRIQQANMTRFMRFVNERHLLAIEDYAQLHAFSIERSEDFWSAVWEFCGIRASGELQPVVDDPYKMPNARWFANVRINFAQNLLRFKDDRIALVGRDETEHRKQITYHDLHQYVQAAAAKLKALGVQPGDRVAAFMPNIPETAIVMLATATLGAVFSSCSPDFGASGLIDRFGQITPKVLVCTDGYRYGGKVFSSLEKVQAAVAAIHSIEHVLVVEYLESNVDLQAWPKAHSYAGALENHAHDSVPYHMGSFADPLYIMYSSGTTGVPKCIVHSVGGTLIQHLKELVLHTDLKREDHLLYYTTCGWMMWNWMISALAVGSTIVVFDGSPSHPSPQILWDLVESERVSVFGTSAKWIAASEKAGVVPRETHRLLALRTILSTGSPLADESFDYIYRDVKDRVLLSSISGGTDLISCFALGNPLLPVYRGELQCLGLGMKVEVLDDSETPPRSLRQAKGELSCTKAFPSMPIGFWNDADGSKYHHAYFAKIPNVWCHGDHAEITAHGGLIIYGRSDATLNPGGVRIGTAEIYRQVEKLEQVLESLAVGQNWDNDVRVVLFVRLREGVVLDATLTQLIKSTIRKDTTPRHVPSIIVQVPDLPRTRSGKLTELAVRQVIHGEAVKNTEALANPESLRHFANLPELSA